MKKSAFFLLLMFVTASQAQNSLNTRVVGHHFTGRYTNDVWGYADSAGNEYALVGHGAGVAVVQVTDSALTEIAFVGGATTIWRDIKTWGEYAYVTSDNTGEGLLILDLSPLPDSVRVVGYQNHIFGSAHNLSIENGFAYISGSDNARGADILDLSNPESPTLAGQITLSYFHDIFVQRDTLFASTGTRSSLAIFDVHDKTNPDFLAEIPFPGRGYSHNSWATPDGKYVMTTEETAGQTVKMWRISNLGNPELESEYLSANGTAHNVLIRGDYAYIAHYADGLRVLDIADPENIVEVGYYDTNPSQSRLFDGDWGAYPFTNSGYVYVSDQDSGLFVIDFNGARAARVKGYVFDAVTGIVIPGVRVSVIEGGQEMTTDFNGKYRFGFLAGGHYTIQAEREGYQSRTIEVDLEPGVSEFESIFLTPITTDVAGGGVSIPEDYKLSQNYPNPFNGGTRFSYALTEDGRAQISIFDLLGRKVRKVVDKTLPAGTYEAFWDGLDENGNALPSGLYFLQMRAGELTLSRKLILQK